jgi:hypothetical protein
MARTNATFISVWLAASAVMLSAQLAINPGDALLDVLVWEGYHDCPEREAEFADEYQAAHSTGPFEHPMGLFADRTR